MKFKFYFLYAVLTLILLQFQYSILAEQFHLDQQAELANVESNLNVGLPDSERTKRSLTTICVEIKPHTPSDEPYFMCKGTDLPLVHKSGNIAIYGGKSSDNNAGGNKHQQLFQDTAFHKSTNIADDNQLYNHHHQQQQQQIPLHSKHSESPSRGPSTKHDEPHSTFSKTDTNRGKYLQPKTTTFADTKYKIAHAGIESSNESENNDGSAQSYETHTPQQREYYEAPIDTFNSDSYSSANARLFQAPVRDYGRPFSSYGTGSENNRGNYEKPYFGARSSFDPGYIHNTDPSYRTHSGIDEKDTTYEQIPTNTRSFTPQSINFPNDELVPSNAFPYSENVPKPYAPNTYIVSAVAPDLSRATDSFVPMQLSTYPIQQHSTAQDGARLTDLEDDVVGVPNWGFSPEEFNIVSTPEISKSLLQFDGSNYKSNKPLIPRDYFDDPVLRTFYESLVDLPTLRSQENLPVQLQKQYPYLGGPSESCSPNHKSLEPHNLGAPFNPTSGYPQSFYPPVLISLPCCGQQSQPYGNAGPVYNMGMSNPFQEPLVGLNNPFANLFGLNRSFQWSHLWNLINPFNNLLGEPNPMMVPHNGLVGMPHYFMGSANAAMPSANRYYSLENQMLGSSSSNNGKGSDVVAAPNPFRVLSSLSTSHPMEATTSTDFDYKNADSTTAATSADATNSEDSEEDASYEKIDKNSAKLKDTSETLSSSTQNPNSREMNAPQVGATVNSSSEESTNNFSESTSAPKLTTEIYESREAKQDRYQDFAGKAKALVAKAKQSSEVESELLPPLTFSSSFNVKRHNPKIVGYTQRKYVQQLQ